MAKRLHGSGENKDAKIVAVDLQAMAPLPGVIQLQVTSEISVQNSEVAFTLQRITRHKWFFIF